MKLALICLLGMRPTYNAVRNGKVLILLRTALLVVFLFLQVWPYIEGTGLYACTWIVFNVMYTLYVFINLSRSIHVYGIGPNINKYPLCVTRFTDAYV